MSSNVLTLLFSEFCGGIYTAPTMIDRCLIDIQRTFSDCDSSKQLISLCKLSLTKMDMPYIPPIL